MKTSKAALSRLALEVRDELGVGVHDALDPFVLAREYGVDVYQLSTFDEVPLARAALTGSRISRFSGGLMPLNSGGMIIIENDAHSPERRRSTMCHELAHVIREHPFRAALTDDKGCRAFDPAHETEAAELGAELLLPQEAAKRCAVYKMTAAQVANRFGVSDELAEWRMRVSGGYIIAQRSARRRGR